jgi:hypothetical protein
MPRNHISCKSYIHYVIKYSSFLHQWNLPPRYNWNFVESGVKHHQTKLNQINYYKEEQYDFFCNGVWFTRYMISRHGEIIFRSLFFQNPYDFKTVLNYLSIQVLSMYYDLEEIIYVLCLTCIFSKLNYNKIRILKKQASKNDLKITTITYILFCYCCSFIINIEHEWILFSKLNYNKII